MEKNRIRPVVNGKSSRMSYSRQKEVLEMPNLIEVQKDSYKWFLDEGLKEVFADISPIADYSGHLSLEFVDFTLCEDDVKYTIEECKERDATYAAPLKVKVRLYNKETDEIPDERKDGWERSKEWMHKFIPRIADRISFKDFDTMRGTVYHNRDVFSEILHEINNSDYEGDIVAEFCRLAQTERYNQKIFGV